jgi:hypothetical protein
MDHEVGEERRDQGKGDEGDDSEARPDRDLVATEAGPEELPGGSTFDPSGFALEGDEYLDGRLGLLDLAHTPLPPLTTAEV